MRILAVSLAVIVMLLVGCTRYARPADTPQVPSSDNTTDSIVLPNEPPEDRTWISPGKVNVGNFYPGARAEYPLTIHNGKDTAASFSVAYRHPDHVGEGYVKPPLEVQDWIIIADSTPVLALRETKDVLVVLDMPRDATVFAPKWEFWVSVKDTTQTGMVRTELASRWLINMR